MNPQSNIEWNRKVWNRRKVQIENFDSSSSSISKNYNCCGNRVPKNQFTIFHRFGSFMQLLQPIVHLSIQSQDRELWLILLSAHLVIFFHHQG